MSRRDAVLTHHREEIRALAARNKAESISLIGSVARGDDTADSDYDFLAQFARGASYSDLWRLELALERLLGGKVDVVSAGGLRGDSLSILDEAMPL